MELVQQLAPWEPDSRRPAERKAQNLPAATEARLVADKQDLNCTTDPAEGNGPVRGGSVRGRVLEQPESGPSRKGPVRGDRDLDIPFHPAEPDRKVPGERQHPPSPARALSDTAEAHKRAGRRGKADEALADRKTLVDKVPEHRPEQCG